MSADFRQTTSRYITEHRTLHTNRCENLKYKAAGQFFKHILGYHMSYEDQILKGASLNLTSKFRKSTMFLLRAVVNCGVQIRNVLQLHNVHTKFRENRPLGSKVTGEDTHSMVTSHS
jgi:hypothetical protein